MHPLTDSALRGMTQIPDNADVILGYINPQSRDSFNRSAGSESAKNSSEVESGVAHAPGLGRY